MRFSNNNLEIAIADGVQAGVTRRPSLSPPSGTVVPIQTHTVNVGVLTDTADSCFPDTDAVVTTLPGVAVGVRTADCVPILMYAPDAGAVAAVHAGWKGTLHGIADRTVEVLVSMGADPARIIAAFGPAICGECYETGDDIIALFAEAGFGACISTAPEHDPLGLPSRLDPTKRHVDLRAVNTRRLLQCGLRDANIIRSHICTRHSCSPDGTFGFPSYRRENATTERLVSWIRLLP